MTVREIAESKQAYFYICNYDAFNQRNGTITELTQADALKLRQAGHYVYSCQMQALKAAQS